MSEPSSDLASVIIPVLNEAETIRSCVAAARYGYGPEEVEIVVVDGGSTDDTWERIPSDVTRVRAPRGRAVQMNHGVTVSQGQVLLFCHADSRLPPNWREAVFAALHREGVSGGVFRTRILPEITWLLWVRNRLPMSNHWWKMHGDQVQFMTRETFEQVGGFPEIPLMEDVEMARALHHSGRLIRLPLYVTTSSRRYRERGTLWQMLWNRWNLFRYVFGNATPEDIARTYHTRRENSA